MKKILITGTGSHIGSSFENWICQWNEKYLVNSIDMKEDSWKDKSFQEYDVVLHVAAIVHIRGIDEKQYFQINRNLAVDVASKAKEQGVKQFVFISTMGVYGTEIGCIGPYTSASPKTPYAKSKLEAEKQLFEIGDKNFKVAVLRPPIVYGKDCKGNYPRLAQMALKLPFIPLIDNNRSMIYSDNLSEFIRLLVEHEESGLFFPQNKDYVNTSQLLALIRKAHGKKTKISSLFRPFICLGMLVSATGRKVFGSLVYDKGMPGGPETMMRGQKIDYETVSFEESIRKTEIS